MFAPLLIALLATDIDRSCQEKFGHPGDLGVTAAAEKYFSGSTSYVEAAATIGEFGNELPTRDADTKAYSWQNGKLEMHFRGDRLVKYRLNGQWREFLVRTTNERAKHITNVPIGRAIVSVPPTESHERRKEFEDFYKLVEQIVKDGNQVAETSQERSDLQALRYHLTKLKEAIAAHNWTQASDIRDSMSISLQRSHRVAEDAQRRLTEQKRMEEERRHREEMRQRERQHQERLRQQQAILNELRIRRGY